MREVCLKARKDLPFTSSPRAWICLLILAVSPGALAQQAQQPVFRAETGLVQVQASITDAAGSRLNDISQSAVRVLENGVPQQVRFVGQENVPVSVALAIDGPAREEVVRTTSAALMGSLASGDLAYVARFDAEPGATPAPVAREQGEVRAVSLRPRTAMRDALLLLIDRMEENNGETKLALIVLAYAETYQSWHSRQEVLDAARTKGVSIYAVDLQPQSEDSARRGNRVAGAFRKALDWTVDLFDNDIRTSEQVQAELKALTDATGGEMCAAANADAAARCAQNFVQDIRSQYVVAYRPKTLARADRKIEITIEGRPEAVVQVRKASRAGGKAAAQR
jgi:VWFA-related protein